MRAFGIEQLLWPTSIDEFAKTFFERKPLFLSRSEPAYHGGLVSLESLDQFLALCRPSYTKAFAIDSRREIATEEFADANGQVDSMRLFQLFEAGATIVYRKVESHFSELASLCRSAENFFNCPFVANVYWAPPNGQSFPIHYDATDVFALQISGSKHWKVYEPVIELPLPHQHCYEALPDQGLLSEFELKAGDCLYCPRGFPHLVYATHEPSLHITLSSHPHTWADVMNRVTADVCGNDPLFRASLPPGFISEGADLEKQFAALVKRFAEAAQLGPAINSMARQFVLTRPSRVETPRRQAQAANALSLDSWIERKHDALHLLEVETGSVRLVGQGREIEFALSCRADLTFAMQASRFQIREMPSDLTCEDKLELVRTLLVHGFVTVDLGNHGCSGPKKNPK